MLSRFAALPVSLILNASPLQYALCSAGQVSGTGSRVPGGHGSFDDGDVMAIELDKDGQVQFFKNGEKFGEKVATQAPAAPAPPGTKYVLVISGTPQGGPGQPAPASECVVRLLNPREGQPQPSSEEETTATTLRPRRVRATAFLRFDVPAGPSSSN